MESPKELFEVLCCGRWVAGGVDACGWADAWPAVGEAVFVAVGFSMAIVGVGGGVARVPMGDGSGGRSLGGGGIILYWRPGGNSPYATGWFCRGVCLGVLGSLWLEKGMVSEFKGQK